MAVVLVAAGVFLFSQRKQEQEVEVPDSEYERVELAELTKSGASAKLLNPQNS